jgi:HAD superfamily hydrolase (TIGR01509 family)
MLAFERLGELLPTREAVVGSNSIPLEQQISLWTDLDPDHCASLYREFYAEIGAKKTTLLPGARDCLQALEEEGLRLGVVTSKQRAMSEMLLRYLGAIHHFESCLGPGGVEFPKPHPEAVLKSIEELRATVEDFLFVGDTEFDLREAKAAGVKYVAVTTGYRARISARGGRSRRDC